MSAPVPIAPRPALDLERHIDASATETLGWMVWFDAGRAIWCGEINREAFERFSPAVRRALRNDIGWFLVEYDARDGTVPRLNALAKVADEGDALRLAQTLARGRIAEAQGCAEMRISKAVKLAPGEGALDQISWRSDLDPVEGAQ